MRGRGLLVAAAVLQFVGAAIFVMAGLGQLVMGAMGRAAFAEHGKSMPFYTIGTVILVVSAGYIVVTIFLLRRRQWAWIASLALDILSAAAFLLLPLAEVGLGEFLILLIFALPLFVTIGLLIGGRHAVLAASAKTAAEPMSVTPPRDG